MARMAKAIARVASSMTNELECGTMIASATSATATIRILICWLVHGASLTPVRTSRSA